MAERAGFAYIPQAADWLASQTLRIPRVKSAGSSLLSKTTIPLKGAFEPLGERDSHHG
jgi:hypothetical protein